MHATTLASKPHHPVGLRKPQRRRICSLWPAPPPWTTIYLPPKGVASKVEVLISTACVQKLA